MSLEMSNDFTYIAPSSRWLIDNSLNSNLFFEDNLHLIREGYLLLTRTIIVEINKSNNDLYEAIGKPEHLGERLNGKSSTEDETCPPFF